MLPHQIISEKEHIDNGDIFSCSQRAKNGLIIFQTEFNGFASAMVFAIWWALDSIHWIFCYISYIAYSIVADGQNDILSIWLCVLPQQRHPRIRTTIVAECIHHLCTHSLMAHIYFHQIVLSEDVSDVNLIPMHTHSFSCYCCCWSPFYLYGMYAHQRWKKRKIDEKSHVFQISNNVICRCASVCQSINIAHTLCYYESSQVSFYLRIWFDHMQYCERHQRQWKFVRPCVPITSHPRAASNKKKCIYSYVSILRKILTGF